MFSIISLVLGVLIVLAVIGAGAVVLWLVFGRRKKGEDKAIGVMEQMAQYKATGSVDAMQRRIR